MNSAIKARVRGALLRRSDAISKRLSAGRTMVTYQDGLLTFDDYLYRPTPRLDETHPPLAWLVERLKAQEANLTGAIDRSAAYAEDLARIGLVAGDDPRQPHWLNDWISGLDAAWLYGAARALKPTTFMEIGSGNSTKFVRRAIADEGAKTRVVSIDPCPRAEIDQLCDVVHRSPLEATDLAVFDELAAGDVLFFDGSHRTFQNSDVTVFFLEVIPRLQPGVLVAVHDIFLPYDYPDDWTRRLYTEQYVLGAYLLGRAEARIDFAANWAFRTPSLLERVETIFPFDPISRIQRDGGVFAFYS